MDQKQSNTITKGIGCFFIFLGVFMLYMGLTFLTVKERNSFENGLMTLFLLSGFFSILGAYQNIKKARLKDKAIVLYELELQKQLKPDPNTIGIFNEPYKPDIIAQLEYTREEWLLGARSIKNCL